MKNPNSKYEIRTVGFLDKTLILHPIKSMIKLIPENLNNPALEWFLKHTKN